MLFNTPEFIIFLVFVICILAVIKNRQFQHTFLLVASYFFFYFSSNYLLSLLIFSTVLDFYLAKEIWKTRDPKKKKILLIFSLAGNLGILGFFKYYDFAVTQFNIFGQVFDIGGSIPLLHLILPIGISFYTFQTISYTVDVYRGKLEPSHSLKEFAIFVSFFPQLVAGPILRASNFLPQLREKLAGSSVTQLKQIIFQNSNLKFGITLIAIGFFKKMFFADNIAPLVNDIFSSPIGSESFTIILGTIAFGIQIYGDFSGYSDIAIGIALILGFKIPRNFNKPYFAISPSDFWQRWHISLSSWLRDYLYIPLGGNKKSRSRTYVNLLIVMFLGGLWHGASWNFVIWGLLHGLYLVCHKLISDKFPRLKKNNFFKTKLGIIISIFITQYLVFLAWIPFRVNNTNDMIYSIQKYLFLDFQIVNTIQIIQEHKFSVILMIIFIILNFVLYKKSNLPLFLSNLKIKYWILFLISVILSILLLYNGNPENFIYFKF